ncbi:MAG: glycosyltransferase family 4 protein [Candidatus Bathyarchaeia archaeon]
MVLFRVLYLAVDCDGNNEKEPVGGGVVRFFKVVEELVKRGVEVHLVIGDKQRIPLRYTTLHIIRLWKHSPKRFWYYLCAIRIVLKTLRLDRKYKYNTLIIPGTHRLNCIASYILKLISKKPLVTTYHHLTPDELALKRPHKISPFRWLDLIMFKKSLHKASLVITVSTFSYQQLLSLGIEGNKIRICGVGIDWHDLQKYLGQKKIYDACFVGRMAEEKGIFDLPIIWSKVTEKFPDSKLVFIGITTLLANAWFAKIESMGVKNIVYMGSVDFKTLYEIMSKSKIFVFPSHVEGWGIAVAESMSLGLPVVAWDIPTIREVFGGSIGVRLAPMFNYQQFATEVQELIKNDEIRQKLGEANREYAKKFTWSQVIDKELEALKEVAK